MRNIVQKILLGTATAGVAAGAFLAELSYNLAINSVKNRSVRAAEMRVEAAVAKGLDGVGIPKSLGRIRPVDEASALKPFVGPRPIDYSQNHVQHLLGECVETSEDAMVKQLVADLPRLTPERAAEIMDREVAAAAKSDPRIRVYLSGKVSIDYPVDVGRIQFNVGEINLYKTVLPVGVAVYACPKVTPGEFSACAKEKIDQFITELKQGKVEK
jgi:hypothetical protein